jgi:hypothetical protein
VPGLLVGAVRGDQPAMRRILGGRKGGRYGIALAALGLAIAVPWRAAPLIALLGLLGAGLGAALQRGPHRLGFRDYLRLSLWIVAPLLLLAAPARIHELDSLAPGLFGVIAGHALLWRNLKRGLD